MSKFLLANTLIVGMALGSCVTYIAMFQQRASPERIAGAFIAATTDQARSQALSEYTSTHGSWTYLFGKIYDANLSYKDKLELYRVALSVYKESDHLVSILSGEIINASVELLPSPGTISHRSEEHAEIVSEYATMVLDLRYYWQTIADFKIATRFGAGLPQPVAERIARQWHEMVPSIRLSEIVDAMVDGRPEDVAALHRAALCDGLTTSDAQEEGQGRGPERETE